MLAFQNLLAGAKFFTKSFVPDKPAKVELFRHVTPNMSFRILEWTHNEKIKQQAGVQERVYYDNGGRGLKPCLSIGCGCAGGEGWDE